MSSKDAEVAAAHPLPRLFRYARGYRRDLALASFYTVMNKLFDIAPEVLIGMLVDTVVRRESSFVADLGVVKVHEQLFALALLTIVIWLCESAFEYLYALRWRNLAQSVQHDLRLDVYRRVQELPMSFFETRSSGEILAVLNDDINQLERFLDGGAKDLIQVGVSTVAVGAIFLVLTPAVAVVALLPIPVILIGAFWFQRRLQPRYADVREKAAQLNGVLNNNLAGIATIKAFVAEKWELEDVERRSQSYRRANADAIRLSSAITPVIRVAILCGFVGTLIYGGLMTLDGRLEVGAYSVLVFLTQRLLWPFTRLAEMTDLYQRAMASTRRALDLLATPVPIRDGHIADESPQWLNRASDKQGAVTVEDLVLDYGEHRALDGVSVVIPAGTTTAFVGTTGSGKSSLVKVLLRFYEPKSGRVQIDGIDIHELELATLRRSIGFVSQDVHLIDGSIADNIAYGSFGASREAIEAAAVAAEAHDFIRGLPEGYETRVGERGQRLSGGQRQRVAIARAVLKDPPILVLDEATSAVDNETEAAIKKSLEHISKGRTTLIIAHRLSTIRHASQICVLEAGEIIERGTHDELLAVEGRYATLWDIQTGAVGEALQG